MSILRTSILPVSRKVLATRALTTSAVRSKTITESVKDAADSLNKKVGQTLASGLDSAADATEAANSKVSSNEPARSSRKVAESAESMRQSANHSLGSAAGKAQNAKDQLQK